MKMSMELVNACALERFGGARLQFAGSVLVTGDVVGLARIGCEAKDLCSTCYRRQLGIAHCDYSVKRLAVSFDDLD